MKTTVIFKFGLLITCLILMASCRHDSVLTVKDNAIYYWRTTFYLTDAEQKFLKKHNVDKLYMRFFDVDRDWHSKNEEEIVPKATIIFKDSVPEGIEVVPTIYITTSAIEEMQLKEAEYADKILKRVKAICLRNRIKYNELQLDCDWTKSTRDYFYKLCEEVKNDMDSTQTLSSTIRLHQLIQTPPPVDKGVLMVYNTGQLGELFSDNSIFSYNDIEPYLRDDRLAKYALPLDVAYPLYGWSVVFHPRNDGFYFNRILKRTDFSDYPDLKKIGKNIYEAVDEIHLDPGNVTYENTISRGYRVKVERPTADEVLEVKRMIDAQLKGKNHSNILYHLDESQTSYHTDNEIDKIYSRN